MRRLIVCRRVLSTYTLGCCGSVFGHTQYTHSNRSVLSASTLQCCGYIFNHRGTALDDRQGGRSKQPKVEFYYFHQIMWHNHELTLPMSNSSGEVTAPRRLIMHITKLSFSAHDGSLSVNNFRTLHRNTS